MASLTTVSKAEALSAASQYIFGFRPSISYTANQAIIRYTPEQNKVVSAYLGRMMSDPSPPELDIDFISLIGPSILPFLLGTLAGGGILGYIIRGKG